MAIESTSNTLREAKQEKDGPVIVDMGKGSRKEVRKLRKGKPGKLLRRLEETVDHLRATGVLPDGAQPVVILVRERARRSKIFGIG